MYALSLCSGLAVVYVDGCITSPALDPCDDVKVI